MRALRLCGGSVSMVQRLGTSASAWNAACALSRRLVGDDAAAALADLAENDGDDTNADGLSAAEPQDAVEEAALHKNQQSTDRSRPLVSKLLPYVYGASAGAAAVHLPVPQAPRPLQRIQRLLEVGTSEELHGVVDGVHLDAAENCIAYVNLVVAYIRHEGNLDHLEGASSAAMRRRAEKTRAHEKGLYLTPEEQNMLLRKACLLVEQRRVSLVVASRLLRHRWPTALLSHGEPKMQRYLTDLVRNWTAEELQAQRLTPSDARAVLLNCAVAFKSQLRQARAPHSTTNSNDETGTRVPVAVTEEQLAALIGSLATTAVADTASPREAEGIIAVMWAVHHSSCPAPMSFWNAMVRRVVQLNASLDGPLLEPTPAETQPQRARSRGTCSPTATAAPPAAGHFFSGLTTRQLYRFLEVLKLVKWSGDVAVLHQLADQTLRNVAFELEAMPLRSGDDKPNKDVPAATARSDTTPSASLAPAASGEKDIKDAPQKDALQQAKRDVTRRIRLVADMSPREFFKLLALAADLRVPFGVSAARVSEELLAPLVPHLSTRDLLMLLQIVRHTQSQSAELLQSVMRRLIEMGPAIPYALTLSKTLIRTAATTPNLFASLQMDAFVHFFLDLCEAQFSLCQPSQVASLADVLYTLGRHYDEASEPGQRIRAVVNLFCTHMDRLLQLHLINTSLVEPLLEATVLLRMRPHPDLYPSVQDLLQTRTAATEKREARRAFAEERRVRAMEEAARRSDVGGAAASDKLGPRWEDVPEMQLPQLSKAAIAVYEEVAYMFERMVVIKAKLNGADFHRFDKDLEKAGLFSLLHGAQLYQQGHLDAQVAHTTPSAKAVAAGIPRALPRWMEKTINTIVHRKLRRCGITAQSTDNDVLKLLGHVHCDAAKVDVVVALIVDSPLHLLKHQRPLWLYVSELARRFGSEETQTSVATYLSKSLF